MHTEVYIEVSARHVHLSQEILNVLFGNGYELTSQKTLGSGFAANESVLLSGPKGTISNVRILGPARNVTQIEISKTDAKVLGIDPPIRMSGELEGSAPITLTGPAGTCDIEHGVIVAKRHIHMDIDTATVNNIYNNQMVQVQVKNEDRSIIFGDVVCRVYNKKAKRYGAAMHIDTDEANAASIENTSFGFLIV